MGRYSNTELASGTKGQGQLSLEQLEYYAKEKEAEKSVDEIAKNIEAKLLLKHLDESNAKYNVKDMCFIVKDSTGQIMWLEKGNSKAGLKHIITRHAADFKRKFGIDEESIDKKLYDIVKTGTVISQKTRKIRGRESYEKTYKYQGAYYVLLAVGNNGFIVSAYPVSSTR